MPSNLPPVPHLVPLLDINGNLHPIWAGWVIKLFQRVGGNVAYTNDELNEVTTERIVDKAVTLPKLQDIATDTLLGRDTAASGVPEQISVGGGIEFSGSGSIRRSALTGDVTSPAGSNATTIANNAVNFAKLLSTDWTNSKASNGYQKLPSGLYIQWGQTGSIASGATGSVPFGLTFPTACLQVIASIRDNSAGLTTATGHFGTGNYSASSFDLYNRTSASNTFSWIAIGH